jgi:hypothetical protein
MLSSMKILSLIGVVGFFLKVLHRLRVNLLSKLMKINIDLEVQLNPF